MIILNIFRSFLHSLPVPESYVLPSDSHTTSDVKVHLNNREENDKSFCFCTVRTGEEPNLIFSGVTY